MRSAENMPTTTSSSLSLFAVPLPPSVQAEPQDSVSTPPATPLTRKPVPRLSAHQQSTISLEYTAAADQPDGRTHRVNSVSSVSSSIDSLTYAHSDPDLDLTELTPPNALPQNTPASGTLLSAHNGTDFEIPFLELSGPTAPAAVDSEATQMTLLNPARQCSFCGTLSTPMWRHGPVGYDPLCNGCGVKWKRGRILQGLEREKSCVTTSRSQSSNVKKQRKSSSASATSPALSSSKSHSHKSSRPQEKSAAPTHKDDRAFTPQVPPAAVLPNAGLAATTSKRRAFAIPTPQGLPNNHRDQAPSTNPQRTRATTADFLPFDKVEEDLEYRTRRTRTTSAPASLVATPAQELHRSMLLKSVLMKFPTLAMHQLNSNVSPSCTVATPSSLYSNERALSIDCISTPCELTGSPLRSAFVCAALETIRSCTGLKVVANAVRWIQRQSCTKSLDPSSVFEIDAKYGALAVEHVEEINLDVEALSLQDWEYLCGILVSAGTL
ncbi:hypothetical protein HDU80_003467 [Chytriomyces hyalinus]|nr:hypothetical protein HDU80_003467 [Chytriomyces hyalinus]